MRYVVECVWRGYQGQLVPCHRRVIKSKVLARKLARISSIGFTDNTTMSVSVREAEPREKVREARGYDELLYDCVRFNLTGYVHVNDVQAARDELVSVAR